MSAKAIRASTPRDEWFRANLQYLALRLEELRVRLSAMSCASDGVSSQGEGTPELDDARRAAIAAGRPPALDLLASMFGLSALEQDLLLLSAAPDLDNSFSSLSSFGDPRRRRPTVALAVALRRGEGSLLELLDGLLPGRPIRRFALVRSHGGADHQPWTANAAVWCDERMTAFLRGTNLRERRLTQLVRPLAGGIEAQEHAPVIAGIAEALSPDGREWPVIRVAAAIWTDARDAAILAAGRAGFSLSQLNLNRFAEQRADWDELCALLAREAALNRMAYWIGNADGPLDAESQAAAEYLLAELEAPILMFPGAAPPESRGRSFALPKLDRQAQSRVWKGALAGTANSVNGDIDRIAQQFDLGPSDIHRIVASAVARAAQDAGSGGTISGSDLWASCREHVALGLGELARRIEPCFAWDDIVVPPSVLAQLRDIASQVEQRARVYEDWGFGGKLSRGRGISVLFSGTSGTGKTMAAEVIAKHLDLDLYRIDLSGIVNKYIGETEKNLRRVFDAAERSGAFLFFDEADALFGTRTEVRDSHDRYANIEVNYLLQRMEDYSGLAVLATNRKQSLDPAFLRRLRFVVDFPFPDVDSRRRIWQRVFPVSARISPLDYSALARLEVPGGNIRSIAVNAAFLAAGEDSPITTMHVMRAAAREFAKIERGISAAEFGTYAEAVRR